jgi:hypothetical protein
MIIEQLKEKLISLETTSDDIKRELDMIAASHIQGHAHLKRIAKEILELKIKISKEKEEAKKK